MRRRLPGCSRMDDLNMFKARACGPIIGMPYRGYFPSPANSRPSCLAFVDMAFYSGVRSSIFPFGSSQSCGKKLAVSQSMIPTIRNVLGPTRIFWRSTSVCKKTKSVESDSTRVQVRVSFKVQI